MEKRAKLILIASIVGIAIMFTLVSFVFAQNSEKEEIELTEQTKEENSPQDVFMQYLQDKINDLPKKEKQEFERLSEMNPEKAFLEVINKLQSMKKITEGLL